MEYEDHEWVPLLPALQLADNTSQNSTTGKSPSLIEKLCNWLFPVDQLKKNLLAIHPTAIYFHYIWKREFDTESRFIAESKEYDNKRYDNIHMKADLREGD
ncbi:hypothetical protein O181_011226 [Austropuccinia psidii MF-1]|uniref:Uncharacterized protein n=1 Tax=Austropuccinia psidii MF-1 TaxID=1389203 RepID=A0A9Q3BSG6_9BASI|nr:hypothetical protein [Austropuccinia psidii MF-1]